MMIVGPGGRRVEITEYPLITFVAKSLVHDIPHVQVSGSAIYVYARTIRS